MTLPATCRLQRNSLRLLARRGGGRGGWDQLEGVEDDESLGARVAERERVVDAFAEPYLANGAERLTSWQGNGLVDGEPLLLSIARDYNR